MEIAEYENIFKNEESHFFYVSTHELIISLVKKYLPPRKIGRVRILDAGCGTGLLAQKLQKFGDVVAVDASSHAVNFSKKRGVLVKKASIVKLPFGNNVFDIVVSVDVLTHKSIKNDLVPLKEFYRVLKPNGILVLRVSANSWLHLVHNKHVHMKHRYDKRELNSKLSKIGFIIYKLSFIHSILFPPIVIRYFWEKIAKPKVKSAIERVNPSINRILTKILLLEVGFFMRFSIPFGVGLIAVAKKPTNTN